MVLERYEVGDKVYFWCDSLDIWIEGEVMVGGKMPMCCGYYRDHQIISWVPPKEVQRAK